MVRSLVLPLLMALVVQRVAFTEGTLFYDAPTGEIFFHLDVPEDRFITFDVGSESDRLIPENFIRLGGPTIIFFAEDNYIADNAGLGTFKQEGFYGLGPIYPPNVSESDFLADVNSTYGTEASTELVPFEIAFERPSGVPRNDPSLPSLAESWAKSAQLTYDANTGNLAIHASGYLSGIVLESSEATDFSASATSWLDNSFSVVADSDVFFVAGLMEPGNYEIESLLPAGLDPDQLSASFESASFRGQAGVGVSPFDFDVASNAMSIVHVPEPAASLFASISWLAALVVLRSHISRAG